MTQNLSTAVAALRNGRLREAEAVCRQLLARNPADAGVLNLLGVIAGTAGDHAAAAELMRQSVKLAPDVVDFRKNLVRALLREGKLEEAEETLRAAVERDPNSPQLLGLWGIIIAQRGRLEQAIEALEKAVRLAPDDPLNHFNLADLYRRNGDRRGAILQLKQVLRLSANHADSLNNLAGLQLAEGDFLGALESIQRLLRINPRSVQGYCNLGTLMSAAGDTQAAETALRNALALDPNSARTRFYLANQLVNVGKLDEAEQHIKEMRCKDDSDRLSLKLTHAKILEHKGDIAGAAEILDALDDKDRSNPEAAIIYATVREQQGRTEEALAMLEAALTSHELVAIDGIGIYFALGDLYDASGRYDEAFGAYQSGNANRKKAFVKVEGPRESSEVVTNRLIGQYEPESYRRCPTSTLDTEVPIFIVGMPRSGTSLVEQILASHSQVFGAGELGMMRDLVSATYDRPQEKKPWSALEIVDTDPSSGANCMVPKGWDTITVEQLIALGTEYLNHICSFGGDALRITDKMPYNYFLAPLIAKIYPRGRIIHCRRHPLDTCLSCFFQNFTGGSEYAFDLAELGEFYRNYLRIMAHWRDQLQLPMLELDYEQLVQAPEANVRRMLDFCGLPWESNCLSFHKSKRAINTASYQQVRKPMYTKSAGRWKNYEKHLDPLIEALGIDRAELESGSVVAVVT
jgi:tetratricopeptide (TPR) repeat protein